MFVRRIGDALMARVEPENYAAVLKREHVREMDFTGRPMKGCVYVDAAGIAGDEELEEWVMRCFGRLLSCCRRSQANSQGAIAMNTIP